jgi:hypothetical protein
MPRSRTTKVGVPDPTDPQGTRRPEEDPVPEAPNVQFIPLKTPPFEPQLQLPRHYRYYQLERCVLGEFKKEATSELKKKGLSYQTDLGTYNSPLPINMAWYLDLYGIA